MIIDFIIEDLMLNSYLQKNFHTLTLEILSKGHAFPLVSQRLPGRMTFMTGNPQMLYTPVQKHTAMYYFGQGLTTTAGHAL